MFIYYLKKKFLKFFLFLINLLKKKKILLFVWRENPRLSE